MSDLDTTPTPAPSITTTPTTTPTPTPTPTPTATPTLTATPTPTPSLTTTQTQTQTHTQTPAPSVTTSKEANCNSGSFSGTSSGFNNNSNNSNSTKDISLKDLSNAAATSSLSLLETMAKSNDKHAIKEHLKKHALDLKNSNEQTLFHLAAMHGNEYVIRQCLKKKYINLEEVKPLLMRDKDGYIGLHCAINGGHFEVAERLLAKGSDPNSRTVSGSTPLHLLAKYSHHPKACKLAVQLLDGGAFINHKDTKFETPLHRATLQTYVVISGDISGCPTNTRVMMRTYNNSSNSLDLIKVFLEHGANPNIFNKRGKTCLHYAIEEGRVDLLELFLEYGAIFTKQPSNNFPSPLELAKESKNTSIIQFFNERIANCGEYILFNDKMASCYIGKNASVFHQSSDQFLVGHSIQLVSGRIFVTNYRVVFRSDASTAPINHETYSLRWPFGESEEMTIPLLSIDSFTSDNHIHTTTTTQPTSSQQSGYVVIPADSQQQQQLMLSQQLAAPPQTPPLSSSGSHSGSHTPNGSLTPNSSSLNVQQSSTTSLGASLSMTPPPSSSTYCSLTITTKDYRNCKLYFTSQVTRDRVIEVISHHSQSMIEHSMKHNEGNRQLQLKIAHDNIHLDDENRMQHIDRYECYGIFEDPMPYLFAHFLHCPAVEEDNGWNIYSVRREYQRFGIFMDGANSGGHNISHNSLDNSVNNNNLYWRFTTLNKEYKLCPTYPSSIVVPRVMLDKDLERVFGFRSKGRIPALSWRAPSGASITRCSQPLVGLERTRCPEDEMYMTELSTQRPVYLIDARPKLNAIANTANGAGFENISNYPNCKLVFLNIANIHVMRRSLEKLVATMSPYGGDGDGKHLSAIEESNWLNHVRGCLAGGVYVAELIQKNISVLVHCSDGWDRTPQLTSLAQVLLDQYYRTIVGLEVLIEKEWLSFGHKFTQRLGHLHELEEERSPIFIQFLDCLFQLVNQFPLLFEYTPALLQFIAEHLFSCKYGTFLYNCEKERAEKHAKTKTVSIWTDVNRNIERFTNPFYQTQQDGVVLRPNLNLRSMEVWKALYMRSDTQNTWLHNSWMIQNHQYLKATQQLQLSHHQHSTQTSTTTSPRPSLASAGEDNDATGLEPTSTRPSLSNSSSPTIINTSTSSLERRPSMAPSMLSGPPQLPPTIVPPAPVIIEVSTARAAERRRQLDHRHRRSYSLQDHHKPIIYNNNTLKPSSTTTTNSDNAKKLSISNNNNINQSSSSSIQLGKEVSLPRSVSFVRRGLRLPRTQRFILGSHRPTSGGINRANGATPIVTGGGSGWVVGHHVDLRHMTKEKFYFGGPLV
ncbi:hypothetical protein SAMD00019534_025470 [Acytostelium subglobosum LB1]|uniref:hypothetical protein n=1 Tax=Acytostelium subglobosum LB1 TaxID=1410327 RepID=UPI000644E694|nr:hypothetical protein SAMD00019534_025470 [Acytostelium subglobosum LB1]GAM19372.1 hypothetical protein SAMD00019534_025470 [Acytostelium subglobosum LB1]|eukprot:XP_012757299.1 hypothetical protein SAMD00019534_025470 [Acytostelium subglobosum LB1]